MKHNNRLLFSLPFLLSLHQPALADLYFSEYIEGSSNNKALEVASSSDTAVDLSDYQISFHYNGSSSAGLTLNLSGALLPGDVYVLAQSSADPAILAQADLLSGAGWFNGDDAVTLVHKGEPVDVIGQIGVDPGSQWGSGDASTQNNTLRRKTDISTGDADGSNPFDPAEEWLGFPQDSFAGLGVLDGGISEPPPPISECGDPATRIHAIQGSGDSSPLAGSAHSVEAVVVGLFQGNDGLNGFFVQERDDYADGDPATSEGLFVYEGSPSTLNPGDLVRVQGSVSEYYGMTQISAADVQVCSTGFAVTPSSLTLPVADLAELEQIEGMLVESNQLLTVNENYNLARYGELVLGSERQFIPTQMASPGQAANDYAQSQALDQIILDDGSTRQNPATIPYPAPELSSFNAVRSGDQVTALRGVINYAFNEYRIQPSAEPLFIPENPRTNAPVLPGEGSLKVASFNVLNYFNGDGLGGGFPTPRGADTPEEFERQRAKIINALVAMDADIVGLVEIENDGYGPESAIQDLVKGLADAGLSYKIVDPGRPQIGSDAIAVGFIYKPESIDAVNTAAILDSTVDSRFLDQKNRPVLAQTFREVATDEVLTLAVTHLKSKGSDCDDLGDPDQNDGQGNCNQTRTDAAEAMVDWLASDPTGSGDEDFLIMGDLNAYAKEDPIFAIETAGYTNLMQRYQGDEAYSYVFMGKAGYLDHALSSESLTAQVTATTTWALNADEARALDYNEEFKTPQQVVSLYSADPWRASDHDPVLLELTLDTPLLGDFNGDDRLNGRDLLALVQHFRKPVTETTQQYDLTEDGHINVRDLISWKRLWREDRHPAWMARTR